MSQPYGRLRDVDGVGHGLADQVKIVEQVLGVVPEHDVVRHQVDELVRAVVVPDDGADAEHLECRVSCCCLCWSAGWCWSRCFERCFEWCSELFTIMSSGSESTNESDRRTAVRSWKRQTVVVVRMATTGPVAVCAKACLPCRQ